MSDLEGWSRVINDESEQEERKTPLEILTENAGQIK